MAVLSLPLSGRPDLAWGCRNIYRTIRMSQCIFAARSGCHPTRDVATLLRQYLKPALIAGLAIVGPAAPR
jgi:hypothetical protein